ncbi:PIN domain protein [Geobacter sp. OR-1]|uniref:type II toxin-antitoxin system VapC family toxin n=1 Tax=Geobacter sp. OR-1 TaxID=1266765 RepID=UPI000543A235|nr:type II toxin-antitoxin system VapC family toxin [Geobacter sp. OR-1]GAM09786.1 PIN domain protein [Geobacter sp. OR-1]
MNFLLDTHTLLWSLFEPTRLGRKGAEILGNADETIFVSVVSFWELSLKYSIGRLELNNVGPEDFPCLVRQAGFEVLPLAEADAATFHHLPRLEHKDPFDCLLIWQAISRKLTFISQDKACAAYKKQGLKVIW